MKEDNFVMESQKGKHLTYEDRLRIEVLYKRKVKPEEIGKLLNGRSRRTIEREIKRGLVKLLDTYLKEYEAYSAEIGQQIHDRRSSNKGKTIKIGHDHGLAKYIEDSIGKDRLSPYATLQRIRNSGLKFATTLSVKTIYNYIDKGYFYSISNEDLWEKRKRRKRGYRQIRPSYHNIRGESISQRPVEIDKREKFGHWEMDTVESGKNKEGALLVLSERQSRKELIMKLTAKNQEQVIRALDKLEKKLGAQFRKVFKTITCDNGTEFLDFEGIEESVRNKKKRTKVYYSHPYSAWERGTNENINKMIRRFIPKGAEIGKYSQQEIQRIENYINNYPRKILAGYPANSIYEKLIAA